MVASFLVKEKASVHVGEKMATWSSDEKEEKMGDGRPSRIEKKSDDIARYYDVEFKYDERWSCISQCISQFLPGSKIEVALYYKDYLAAMKNEVGQDHYFLRPDSPLFKTWGTHLPENIFGYKLLTSRKSHHDDETLIPPRGLTFSFSIKNAFGMIVVLVCDVGQENCFQVGVRKPDGEFEFHKVTGVDELLDEIGEKYSKAGVVGIRKAVTAERIRDVMTDPGQISTALAPRAKHEAASSGRRPAR